MLQFGTAQMVQLRSMIDWTQVLVLAMQVRRLAYQNLRWNRSRKRGDRKGHFL